MDNNTKRYIIMTYKIWRAYSIPLTTLIISLLLMGFLITGPYNLNEEYDKFEKNRVTRDYVKSNFMIFYGLNPISKIISHDSFNSIFVMEPSMTVVDQIHINHHVKVMVERVNGDIEYYN